ncbi:MAG TPA: HEAT repeat domain-containing protein, partial [Planctomycetota bacterium]|nr:HEAT repeat domain-containing protein [Planctomycetota bacterium]
SIKIRSLIELPPKLAIRPATPPKSGPVAEAPAVPLAAIERVDQILEEMRRAKEGERFVLASSFVQLGREGARALTARLSVMEPELREPVVNVLLQMTEKDSRPELQGLLKNGDPKIRAIALQLIANLAEPAFAADARPFLGDPSDIVRGAAVDLLRDLGNDADLPVVAEVCIDPKDKVRHKAVAASINLSSKYEQKDRLVRILVTQLSQNLPVSTKSDLLLALGRVGSKDVIRDVAWFLSNDSAELRRAAIDALADLEARDEEEGIVRRMSTEPDRNVRMGMALASQRLGFQSAIPVMIQWLSDPDAEFLSAVQRALVTMTSQDFGVDQVKWTAWWGGIKKR